MCQIPLAWFVPLISLVLHDLPLRPRDHSARRDEWLSGRMVNVVPANHMHCIHKLCVHGDGQHRQNVGRTALPRSDLI